MKTSELPLFELDSTVFNTPEVAKIEEIYYAPVQTQTNNLEQTLNAIFPQSQELSKSERARGILGEISRDFTDEQLANLVSDFSYLTSSWLDIFERQTYGGKTLSEILKVI